MFRLFCCACCALVCSVASADTLVQDGDYFPELWVTEGSLEMTGGQVDRMILWGNGPYEIDGGDVGSAVIASGDHLYIRGGDIGGVVRSEDFNGSAPRIPVTYEGRYFRVYDRGLKEHNSYRVEGWLSDGSWISSSLVNEGEEQTSNMPVVFQIVPGDHPSGDTDLDWDVDLTDLNSLRNNFGGAGQGDLNGNGVVDLEDLNLVRNNFGAGAFTLTHDNPGSLPFVEITETTSFPLSPAAVPEPSTLALALILLPLLRRPR